MPDSPDDRLTIKDIATLFEVHEKTVRRWDKLGLLPRPSFATLAFRFWTRKRIEAWIEIGGIRAFRCPRCERRKARRKASEAASQGQNVPQNEPESKKPGQSSRNR